MRDVHPHAFRRLVRRYGWDEPTEDADENRILLRTLSIGLWDDILEVERLVGRDVLARLVRHAPAGALTPRAWSFWHYRLGLTAPTGTPPPLPTRKLA